jgi:hypothetical protein
MNTPIKVEWTPCELVAQSPSMLKIFSSRLLVMGMRRLTGELRRLAETKLLDRHLVAATYPATCSPTCPAKL